LTSISNDVFPSQLAVFKDQNTQLLEEFASLSQQLTATKESCADLESQLCQLLGEPAALENVTIEECEELESRLKLALQRIDAKKVSEKSGFMSRSTENVSCVHSCSVPMFTFRRR
jgi:phage shock protein A